MSIHNLLKKKNRGQKITISPVHEYSNKHNILVRHPKRLDDEKELQFIKKVNPDVVVVVAYGKILPDTFLNIDKIKFINVHASLLPRWRGAAPIQRSIINMDQETGISIMKIVSKLDAGPFMLQEKIKIEKNDNYKTLSEKLANLGSKLILEALSFIEKNNYNLYEQNEGLVSYAKKIEKKETEIKWSLPAKNLIAKINGLNPSPGAWFNHNNNRIKVFKAIEVEQSGNQGEVLDDNLTIACKEKAIKILLLQRQGKKILNPKEFLTGYQIKKGENLV